MYYFGLSLLFNALIFHSYLNNSVCFPLVFFYQMFCLTSFIDIGIQCVNFPLIMIFTVGHLFRCDDFIISSSISKNSIFSFPPPPPFFCRNHLKVCTLKKQNAQGKKLDYQRSQFPALQADSAVRVICILVRFSLRPEISARTFHVHFKVRYIPLRWDSELEIFVRVTMLIMALGRRDSKQPVYCVTIST